MAYAGIIIPVMIASPSDVVAERNIAREIISKWNIVHSAKEKAVLLPVGWDTHSSPDLSGRPQSLINERILKNADLLLGIFWTRLGSPTGGFQSGSVEEVEHHLSAGKPAMLYFSEKLQQPSLIDPAQYQALQDFKKSCLPRGIVESFETEDDFREKFRDQLQLILNENQYMKDVLAKSTSQSRQLSVPSASLARYTGAKLTEESKALLVAGARDEDGTIFHRQSIGSEGIIANKQDFIGNSPTPRSVAKWIEALTQLRTASLVVPVNEYMYKLTAQGFKIADILIENGMNSDIMV